VYFRLAFLQLFRDKRVVHDFLAMLIPFVGMYLIFSLMPLLQTDDLDEETFRLLGPSAQGARVLFFCMVAFIGLIAFVFLTMRLRKNLSYYLLLNVLGFSAFRIAVLHLVELVLLLGLTIPMGTVVAALLGLLLRGSLAHFDASHTACLGHYGKRRKCFENHALFSCRNFTVVGNFVCLYEE